jgi:hypothetical protein
VGTITNPVLWSRLTRSRVWRLDWESWASERPTPVWASSAVCPSKDAVGSGGGRVGSITEQQGDQERYEGMCSMTGLTGSLLSVTVYILWHYTFPRKCIKHGKTSCIELQYHILTRRAFVGIRNGTHNDYNPISITIINQRFVTSNYHTSDSDEVFRVRCSYIDGATEPCVRTAELRSIIEYRDAVNVSTGKRDKSPKSSCK